MAGTFISYRRDDAAGYAGRLRESLERRLGADQIFRDVDTLRPGQDFVDAINARLSACRVMLVVIGREWLDARLPNGTRRLEDPVDFVRLEVSAGLANPAVVVIPVLVEGVTMPASESLPQEMRALARRHAISLRDETWDEDLDRLVAAITEVSPADPGNGRRRPPSPGRGTPSWVRGSVIAAALVIVGLVGLLALRSFRSTSESSTPAQSVDPSGTAQTPGPAYTIDVPRVAEVAFGQRIFTLVSGNVVPRGDRRELRLRLRFMNYESVSANFWNDTFRLSLGGQVIAPSGDLNEVVPGHSLRYGLVTFALPATATAATLQLIDRDRRADVVLDLSPSGRPPVDEQAEIPDSLSQAIMRSVRKDPAPLIANEVLEATLTRVTSRLFANTLRLSVELRLVNRSRGSVFTGDLVIRMAAAGDVVAPLASLGEALDAGTSTSPTLIFDLPPMAERAELRALLGGRTATTTFELR